MDRVCLIKYCGNMDIVICIKVISGNCWLIVRKRRGRMQMKVYICFFKAAVIYNLFFPRDYREANFLH